MSFVSCLNSEVKFFVSASIGLQRQNELWRSDSKQFEELHKHSILYAEYPSDISSFAYIQTSTYRPKCCELVHRGILHNQRELHTAYLI